MIHWGQRKKKIGGFTNSTYLALIHKEACPSAFPKFQPISLCNSSYKIITKILATYIKTFLPSLIPENQQSFLAHQQISDSILMVQEVIHSSMSGSKKGFALKLDLVNAFDRVRHSFLYSVLRKMGFNEEIIFLIQACISHP